MVLSSISFLDEIPRTLSQLRSIEYWFRIEIKGNPKVLVLLEVVLEHQKPGLRSVMVV